MGTIVVAKINLVMAEFFPCVHRGHHLIRNDWRDLRISYVWSITSIMLASFQLDFHFWLRLHNCRIFCLYHRRSLTLKCCRLLFLCLHRQQQVYCRRLYVFRSPNLVSIHPSLFVRPLTFISCDMISLSLVEGFQ